MYGHPFLEFIADTPPGDSLRSELAAGLAVIHLADSALLDGDVDADVEQLTRQQVARVPHVHFNGRLREILDLIVPVGEREYGWRLIVGARLMTYGHELHHRRVFAPAAAVFSLVAERFADDPALRLQAIRWKAFALRLFARLDDAELAYSELQREATATGDAHMVLKARLGLACLVLDRGNIPKAANIIDTILTDATAAGDKTIQGEALVNKAFIAGGRGSPLGVIRHCEQALHLLTDRAERDRCQVNMAEAYRQRRQFDRARTIASRIRRHGLNPDERGLAAEVLYDIAFDQDDRRRQTKCLEWFRRNLGCPLVDVIYYSIAARDMEQRRDFDGAIAAVRTALAIAEASRLGRYVIAADARIGELETTRAAATTKPLRAPRPQLQTVGGHTLAAAGDVATARPVALVRGR